jgi:uncharacterized protein (DUF427 family)
LPDFAGGINSARASLISVRGGFGRRRKTIPGNQYGDATMAKAMWNGAVIAESKNTVLVEGNHYFPLTSVKSEYLEASSHSSVCVWKGEASYYSLVVDGQRNQDAAWFYAEPKSEAVQIKDHVAFWRGVRVEA